VKCKKGEVEKWGDLERSKRDKRALRRVAIS